jgi:hypothetical protein
MDISQHAKQSNSKASGPSSHIQTPPTSQSEEAYTDSQDLFGYTHEQIVKVPFDKLKE